MRTPEEIERAIQLVKKDQKLIDSQTHPNVIYAINNTLEILEWVKGDNNLTTHHLNRIEKRQNAANHNSRQ